MTNENLALLKRAIDELGPLTDQVVFVGGITTFLHLPASVRDLRNTLDVDVVINANRIEMADFEAKLRRRGFIPDKDLICRHQKDEIIIDVLPIDPKILGFSNSWYQQGFVAAESVNIEERTIKVLSFPYFLATKLEAFAGRGKQDYYGSKDLEDIVAVMAGRPRFSNEIASTKDDPVRDFIVGRFKQLLAIPDFVASITGHMPKDALIDATRIHTDLRSLVNNA